MNISVFIIECIIMAVLFGILVFGMLFTSSLTFISDYPPEIQEEYYRIACSTISVRMDGA